MNPALPPLPLAITSAEIVVALVVVIGGLIKHVMEKAKAPADRRSQRTPPLIPPRPPLSTPEEERARRLMEALGRPGQGVPPALPPALPRTPRPPPLPPNVVTRRPGPPISAPLLVPSGPPRPVGVMTPDAPPGRQPRRPKLAVPDPVPRSPAGSQLPGAGLRGRLGGASRAELRRAILLREVLGPPRALSEPGGASM